jgi:hypothetical protein
MPGVFWSRLRASEGGASVVTRETFCGAYQAIRLPAMEGVDG